MPKQQKEYRNERQQHWVLNLGPQQNVQHNFPGPQLFHDSTLHAWSDTNPPTPAVTANGLNTFPHDHGGRFKTQPKLINLHTGVNPFATPRPRRSLGTL